MSKAQSNKDVLRQTASVEQNKIKDEMIAKYKRAIELNPNDAEAHYFLGLTYYTKRALDDAIAELQTSLRLNPDNAKNNGRLRLTADAHYNLACAYSLKNEKAQAIRHLGQAIRLNPGYIRGAQMDPDLSDIKDSKEFQTLVKK